MALKDNKDRINLVIEKEYKEQLQKLAKDNRVTLSNFCATVLVKYIEKKITVRVSPELYKKFKIKLLQDERTMKEVVTEFIIKYIEK